MNWSSQVPSTAGEPEQLRWLVLDEDAFSRRISLPNDPLFWWRMETNDPDHARITDFNPGEQNDDVMSACLELLLKQTAPGKVSFIDLVPADLPPNEHRLKLNQVAQRVQTWVKAAIAALNREVDDISLEHERGKACLVVTIAPERGG